MTDPHVNQTKEATPSRWLKLLRFRIVIPAIIVLALLIAPFAYRLHFLSQVSVIDEPFDTKAFGTINIPANENAFVSYEFALTKRDNSSKPDGVELEKALDGDWSAASGKTRQWLKDNQEALEHWKKGTTKPHYLSCQPKDLTFVTSLPAIDETRTWARLASLSGKQLEAEGKFVEAQEWYQAIFRYSRHLGQHGCSIERLLGKAFHSMAAELMLRWSEYPEVTSQQLKQARMDIIMSYRLTAPASVLLKCEFFILSNLLNSQSELESLAPEVLDNSIKAWLNNLTDVEPEISRRTLSHYFKNILTQIDLPLYQRKQATVTGIALFDNSSFRSATDSSLTYGQLGIVMEQTDYLKNMLPMSVHSQYNSSADREITKQGILIVVLAVQQYQREHGKFPPDSATLIKEKYLDEIPLDGQQTVKTNIQYKQTAKCTVVYGLGIDHVDNGGCIADLTGRPTGDYGYVLGSKK